jgi:hypothetical protein
MKTVKLWIACILCVPVLLVGGVAAAVLLACWYCLQIIALVFG